MSDEFSKSKRMMVQIPVGSEVHNLLMKNGKVPHWQLLNELVKQLPKSKEDRAITVFNNFIEQMCELYPERKMAFEMLRPLVFKQILNKEPCDPWYYEELRKV